MAGKGIASGGNFIVDYVKMVDSYPKPGNLSNILSIEKAAGGAPVNCLIDLSVIDPAMNLQSIGIVGNDEGGEYLLNVFKKHNIDTSMVQINNKYQTSFTDVMTVESTGERTFFHYRGTNSMFGYENFDFSKINADILHIGYALLLDRMDSEDEEYGTVMARTLAEAQKHGIKTSIDVVSENSERYSQIVPPSLKYTNYCIVNEVEASAITGIPAREGNMICIANMKSICEKLFDMGVHDLVVIHAPEIGFSMDKTGAFCYQPSLDLPSGYIKGTVGAGDAFCAGVLYAIYNGWHMERAIEVGNGAAACSLSEANATDGMKSIDSILDLIKTLPKRKLEDVAR